MGRRVSGKAGFPMNVTIYHNPRCSKSRATLALLEERGIAPTVVEYLKNSPDAETLGRIAGMLGMAPKDMLRKKEAKDAGIDPDAGDAAVLAGIAANPAALERPIVVVDNSRARIGRPPESVLEIL